MNRFFKRWIPLCRYLNLRALDYKARIHGFKDQYSSMLGILKLSLLCKQLQEELLSGSDDGLVYRTSRRQQLVFRSLLKMTVSGVTNYYNETEKTFFG